MRSRSSPTRADVDGETVIFSAFDGSGARALLRFEGGVLERVTDSALGPFDVNGASIGAGVLATYLGNGTTGASTVSGPRASPRRSCRRAIRCPARPARPSQGSARLPREAARSPSRAATASSGGSTPRWTARSSASRTAPSRRRESPPPFISFGPPAADGPVVAFEGFGVVGHAIFASVDGALIPVFHGTRLDGAELLSLEMGQHAVSGHRVSFLAHFLDGRSAIYVAELPATQVPALPPAGVALLALALATSGALRTARLRHR